MAENVEHLGITYDEDNRTDFTELIRSRKWIGEDEYVVPTKRHTYNNRKGKQFLVITMKVEGPGKTG